MTHWTEKLIAEILLWLCLAVSASAWAISLAAGVPERLNSPGAVSSMLRAMSVVTRCPA